nr:NES-PhoCl2c-mCherry [Cloning vector pcDNA-NES-PhoCl2c-mCherry]
MNLVDLQKKLEELELDEQQGGKLSVIPDYFKQSFPEGYSWERSMTYEDGGICIATNDITMEGDSFINKIHFQGTNFPPNGPVMQKRTVGWEASTEKMYERDGVLKGDVKMKLLLKGGGHYRGDYRTTYKVKQKPVKLPDCHFVDHRIEILSHDKDYNKVKLYEHAVAKTSTDSMDELYKGGSGGMVSKGEETITSVIKPDMKNKLRMEGNVNGHAFVIEGEGSGKPFEGIQTIDLEVKEGAPLPFAYDILTTAFHYGNRVFTKYPRGTGGGGSGGGGSVSKGEEDNMAIIKEFMRFKVHMEGSVNGHEFEIEGEGEGRPYEGTQTAKLKVTKGGPLPFAWDILSPQFMYGSKAYVKHPADIPDYLKLSFPEGFKWERVMNFEDGGVVTVTQDSSLQDGEFIYKVKLRGTNFPSDGPVMQKKTMGWEASSERMYPEDGALKGEIKQRLKLKDGGHYDAEVKTTYKAKKPVQLPGAYNVNIKLDITSHNEDYTIVEQYERAEGRHSTGGMDELYK